MVYIFISYVINFKQNSLKFVLIWKIGKFSCPVHTKYVYDHYIYNHIGSSNAKHSKLREAYMYTSSLYETESGCYM